MRVITGSARGRKLKTLPGEEIVRPTTDRVKESIFNIIQFDIEGRPVLDLFAGTGQLGIEALSRGAKSAVFVDSSAAAKKLVEENLKISGLEGLGKTVLSDYRRYLESAPARSFGLVFIDPPYKTGIPHCAVTMISQFDILIPGGIIVCETAAAERIDIPEECGFSEKKEYIYGKIKITVFIKRV